MTGFGSSPGNIYELLKVIKMLRTGKKSPNTPRGCLLYMTPKSWKKQPRIHDKNGFQNISQFPRLRKKLERMLKSFTCFNLYQKEPLHRSTQNTAFMSNLPSLVAEQPTRPILLQLILSSGCAFSTMMPWV